MPIAGPPPTSMAEETPSGRPFTRRRGLVLAALGPLGLLAACSADPATTSSVNASDAVTTTPDPASEVAAEEREMIALYDVAISALPAGPSTERALLERIRSEHAAHLAALADAAVSGNVPADRASGPVSLRDLLGAERRASRSRVSACVEASDPELARILSLIGASEAGHVAALRGLT